MKRNLIFAIILIIILIFFYPKPRVEGGLRGFIVNPNATAYRVEYDCLGIPYDYTFPDGGEYLCFGVTYNKRCFNETTTQKIPLPCI